MEHYSGDLLEAEAEETDTAAVAVKTAKMTETMVVTV
jgi:hypothetical protein